jgi:hypothetical protein
LRIAAAAEGVADVIRARSRSRSLATATWARTLQLSELISASVVGCASRLSYHAGFRTAPKFEARTATAVSPAGHQARGVTRLDSGSPADVTEEQYRGTGERSGHRAALSSELGDDLLLV